MLYQSSPPLSQFELQFKSIQSIPRVKVQITSKLILKLNRHVEYGHTMKQTYKHHMHCMFQLT